MTGVPCVWKWCAKSEIIEGISSPLEACKTLIVTFNKVSRTKPTSVEPIHCLLLIKSEDLSPISTKHFWISLWVGIGLSVYPCNLKTLVLKKYS